jgi:hypothetical protein
MGKRKAIPAAVKRAVLARFGMICEAEGCESVGWRDIPGYEGIYQVSADGFVRSLPRMVKNSRSDSSKLWRGKTLTPTIGGKGYATVMLRLNGQSKRLYVHRLVLLAFQGSCPDNWECRHLNGNRSDNRLANLAWGTKHENMADKRAHGTHMTGESCPASKLNLSDVIAIKRLLVAGVPQSKVGERFGVTQTTISDINCGRTWGAAI